MCMHVGIKLSSKEKAEARYKQIRKWLKIHREKGEIRARGRPKDSSSATTDQSVQAIDNFYEEKGYAAQVVSGVCTINLILPYIYIYRYCIHTERSTEAVLTRQMR